MSSPTPVSESMEESPEFTRAMVQSFCAYADIVSEPVPDKDGVVRARLVRYRDFRPVAGTALERVFKSGGES